MLNKYLQKLIDKHLDSDISRFDELWEIINNFNSEVKEVIKQQNAWLYLKKETYDGWYLIKEKNVFDLYYQEKGRVKRRVETFNDEKLAFKELIRVGTDLGI